LASRAGARGGEIGTGWQGGQGIFEGKWWSEGAFAQDSNSNTQNPRKDQDFKMVIGCEITPKAFSELRFAKVLSRPISHRLDKEEASNHCWFPCNKSPNEPLLLA
jgi:hypothetical protein